MLRGSPLAPASQAARALSVVAMASFRNPHNLPTKVCVTCGQKFTWRKKWEASWDVVTTCSKRCNGERKREARLASRPARLALTLGAEGDLSDSPAAEGAPLTLGAEGDPSDSPAAEGAPGPEDAAAAGRKASRKAARQGQKAERRAKREGSADASAGQKPCSMCATGVDLLVRCQLGSGAEWSMVCGRCWNKPEVAGGVHDGSGTNPNYRYGGLWRNHHRQPRGARAVPMEP